MKPPLDAGIVLFLLIVGGGHSEPVDLHPQLVESEPASGETLEGSPDRIRLVFSEPVEPGAASISILREDGDTFELTVRQEAGAPRDLTAAAPALGAGAYRVSWRVVAADGHPVSGSFPFDVSAEEPGEVPAGDTEGGDEPPAGERPVEPAADTAGQAAAEEEGPGGASLARGFASGSLMALAGLLFFLAWAGPAAAGRGAIPLARILSVAAPILIAAHFLLWLAYALPPGGGGVWEWLRSGLALETGQREAARLGLSLGAGLVFLVGRRTGLAAVLALAAVATSGAIGHSAAIVPVLSIPAKSVHLLAAALWLGGLLFLATGPRERPTFPAVAGRVSSVALGAVVVIAATGILQVLLLVPSPGLLLGSRYGLFVALKILGLGVLILFGIRNRYRLLPGLDEGDPPRRLKGSVSRETAVLMAVILVAGFLAYIPPPPGAGA